MKLTNKTDTLRWGFSIDNVAIDYVDIFLINDQGELVDSALLGDMRPFSQRKLQTLAQSASFELNKDQHLTILIKAYGQSTLFLPVSLATEKQLQLDQSISMVFIVFLIGIMFALGLNNLYIFYSIGDKTYLYYCFYLTSLIGFALYTSGMGYQYLWRDSIAVQNIITFIFLGMLFHGALSFSQYFLQTKTRLPRMHLFINYFKYVAYFSIPVALLISKSMAVSLLTLVNICFIFTVIYCGVQSARQRYTPAYFYLVSWLFLIIGLMTYNLTVKGLISPNFYTTKAIPIGSAIEAILLSSALAFRMRRLITERNLANENAKIALMESNEKMAESLVAAKQYNKAKDEFLNVVNHELRTPMNSIIGYLELMKFDQLSEDAKVYLKGAQLGSNKMMRIIENMLFITESGSKKINLQPSEVEFKFLFSSTLTEFSTQAEQEQIHFAIEIADDIPEVLFVDWNLYHQLLDCIIENAIKFTAKGNVSIKAYLHSNESKKYFVCSIQDTGIGMSKEQLNKLFVPFSQANTSYTRPADGLGLGLTVAKQIAERLGVTIEIESDVGKGTKATVSLPIE